MESSSAHRHQQGKTKAGDCRLMIEQLRKAIYRAFFGDLDGIACGSASKEEIAEDLSAREFDIDPADEIFPRPLRHKDMDEPARPSVKSRQMNCKPSLEK